MRHLAWLLLACCAAGEDARFEMSVQGLNLADVAQLQLAVLTDRRTVDCAAVTQGCVKDQFPSSRFVDLRDARGVTAKGVLFGRDGGVEVSMPPGRDFAFVIEALTDVPELAGSSCTYVENVTSGSNRITANPITIRADAGVISSCDPRL
jgi:hypothetical protein